MATPEIFKVSRKTFFNPSAWINYDGLKTNTQLAWAIISGLFVVPTPDREESFEQAKKRLKLSEADLEDTKRNYLLFALIFAALGLIVFVFSFYLLFFHRTFHAWLIGIPASGLFFAQAFRFHFWYFQIKHRKLGCTFEEWRRGFFERNPRA